jgi:hypothetical protein
MFNHMFGAFVDDLEKKSRLSSEFSGTLAEDSRFNIWKNHTCVPSDLRVGCDAMRRSRWILLFLLLFTILASWLWWVRPSPVDMATYAPADSLLYLEANRPSQVVEALAGTDAGKTLENMTGSPTISRSHWVQNFIGWTGIGPIESVILARAQIAAVVTDLGTTEEGDELRIKPELAVLIETHTSERRIRPLFEQSLKTLAEKTYGRPTARRTTLDGVEFVEWIAPDGSRQIVGAIVGSLVVVGNSERAVQTCLGVSLGRRPALKADLELTRMRHDLDSDRALTFGYVPPGNSARLLAVSVPLLFGRAPADSDFQRLITKGAARVFGSLGWTSKSFLTGIEDRYLVSLQPEIVARLKPNFAPANSNSQLQRILPRDTYSVTSYRFANPAATWQSLKTAVSSQVDALSAIVFSSLLKSTVLSYGIDDPETFLGAVDSELLTVRLDENAERSILIARVRDKNTLHEFVKKNMRYRRGDPADRAETFEDSQGDFASSFIDEVIVMGTPADVRHYIEIRRANAQLLADEDLKRMNFFLASPNSASIVTYSQDSDRVRSFIATVLAARGVATVTPGRIEEALAGLPYSVTETTLLDSGIERITRSPLGQFSTLLPLLVPEQPGPIKHGTESR